MNTLDYNELPVCFEPIVGQIACILLTSNKGILFTGSPGTARTMLARRAVSLLGDPSESERAAIREVLGAAGLIDAADPYHLPVPNRPFRAPHYTVSAAAMSGMPVRPARYNHARVLLANAKPARPGEVQLAMHGVLFLDELHEFARGTLEATREALYGLERRAPRLIASVHPCPCGHRGTSYLECLCTPEMIQRFETRILNSIRSLTGFDMIRIDVPYVPLSEYRAMPRCASSETFRSRYQGA